MKDVQNQPEKVLSPPRSATHRVLSSLMIFLNAIWVVVREERDMSEGLGEWIKEFQR